MSAAAVPHDLALERGWLGGSLMALAATRQHAIMANSRLVEGDFFRRSHAVIYRAITAIAETGAYADEVGVTAWLRAQGHIERGDVNEIELGELTVGAMWQGCEASAHQLRDLARRRRVIEAFEQAARLYRDARVTADERERACHLVRQFLEEEPEATTAQPWAVPGDQFLVEARASATTVDVVEGFLPSGVISLHHGQPRDGKTWAALAVGLAVANGAPAFGVFPTRRPGPVLYVTNEDPRVRIADRVEWLCAGHGYHARDFHVLAHAAAHFDDPLAQRRLVAEVKRLGAVLTIADPMRSLTARVDQGPAEFQPCGAFLRQLVSVTGTTLLLTHHDVKPNREQQDTRARAQQASGGGIFSHCECPSQFEKVRESPSMVAIVRASGWKHGECPGPVELTLTTSMGEARLIGRRVEEAEASRARVADRVIAHLGANGELTGAALVSALRLNRQAVITALHELERTGRVAMREGPRNAKFWSAVPAVPSRSENGSQEVSLSRSSPSKERLELPAIETAHPDTTGTARRNGSRVRPNAGADERETPATVDPETEGDTRPSEALDGPATRDANDTATSAPINGAGFSLAAPVADPADSAQAAPPPRPRRPSPWYPPWPPGADVRGV